MYYIRDELVGGATAQPQDSSDSPQVISSKKPPTRIHTVADLAAVLCREFLIKTPKKYAKKKKAGKKRKAPPQGHVLDWLKLSLDGTEGYPLLLAQSIGIVRDDDTITLSTYEASEASINAASSKTSASTQKQQKQASANEGPSGSNGCANAKDSASAKRKKRRRLARANNTADASDSQTSTPPPAPLPSGPPPPLSPDEVQQYMRRGFVLLKNAFPKSAAAEVRKLIWERSVI